MLTSTRKYFCSLGLLGAAFLACAADLRAEKKPENLQELGVQHAKAASKSLARRSLERCDSTRDAWPGNGKMAEVTDLAGPEYPDEARAALVVADRLGLTVCFEKVLDRKETAFAVNYAAPAIFLPAQPKDGNPRTGVDAIKSARAAFATALQTITIQTNNFSRAPELSMSTTRDDQDISRNLSLFTIPYFAFGPRLPSRPDMSFEAIKLLTPPPLRDPPPPEYDLQKILGRYWI